MSRVDVVFDRLLAMARTPEVEALDPDLYLWLFAHGAAIRSVIARRLLYDGDWEEIEAAAVQAGRTYKWGDPAWHEAKGRLAEVLRGVVADRVMEAAPAIGAASLNSWDGADVVYAAADEFRQAGFPALADDIHDRLSMYVAEARAAIKRFKARKSTAQRKARRMQLGDEAFAKLREELADVTMQLRSARAALKEDYRLKGMSVMMGGLSPASQRVWSLERRKKALENQLRGIP